MAPVTPPSKSEAETTSSLPKSLSWPPESGHEPRGRPRSSRRTKIRATVLVLVHVAVIAHLAHWQLSGETLTPLEPSEAIQTLELGWINAGFLLFVGAILLTLVVGRFFCGWACHVVAYQDLCAALLGRFGLRPRAVRSRLLAFVPLFAAGYLFAWPLLARVLRGDVAPELSWHLWTEDFWVTFPGPWVGALTLLVDGVLVVWLLGAKGFCTYGCPYGALFGVADRVAPGRIRVTDACEGCGHCTATCTSNVAVHVEVARHGQVVDPGCMKCLDCVDVCPKDALYFGFQAQGRARERAVPTPRRAQRKWDFSWGQELVLAALFLGGFLAFRGLYDRVPFLLALGCGAVTAVAGHLAFQAVRAREFTFQGLILRTAGRITRAGRTALGLAWLALILSLHAGAVQLCAWQGERLLVSSAPTSAEPLRSSRAWLERANSLGWAGNARIEHQLGSIAQALSEPERAVGHLRAAVALEGRRLAPRLLLGEVLLSNGEVAQARAALDGALSVGRTSDPRKRDLTLRALRKRADVAILERDWPSAEAVLSRLLEAEPDDSVRHKASDDLGRVRQMSNSGPR